MKKIALLAVGAVFALATTATAGIVQWTLQDATFVDGGTIEGGFQWDGHTDSFLNNTVRTTDGAGDPVVPGTDFSGINPRLDLSNTPDRIFFDDGAVRLVLFGDFTGLDTEGEIDLIGHKSQGFFERYARDQKRFSIGGGSLVGEEISPVPVPAALPILMTGLGALVMVRRRRKS